ncbi:hypothetical protein ABID37_003027 [Aquamicrobium terrae]|uniref:Propionyl-coenzyme A carboxylase alpha polypeptide n=1 Tax=Aquamicrobium terrae TaxID=1324945 RepID=A0ABV2N169_9HYPH
MTLSSSPFMGRIANRAGGAEGPCLAFQPHPGADAPSLPIKREG